MYILHGGAGSQNESGDNGGTHTEYEDLLGECVVEGQFKKS